MTKILIKKLSKEAIIPKYETDGSSGMDISACIDEEIKIFPGEKAIIRSGISLSIPKGFEVQIRPRSGLALKQGITVLNSPGTIDADYRGEIKVILINHGDAPFVIEHEMRIAQMVVEQYQRIEFKLVKELTGSERGSGGFGSTGTQ